MTIQNQHTALTGIAATQTGIVIKKSSTVFCVSDHNQSISCTLAPHLLRQSGGPITVGDAVQYHVEADGSARISALLPRRNWLSRRAARAMPGSHASEQVLVANVDQVIPVFAVAEPAPKWNMLDRYLVTAEANDLPALIVITKLDLLANIPHGQRAILEAELAEYRRVGYQVLWVSSHTGAGLDELRHAMTGRISVLVGKSGVGKTSLLNALQPGLGLRVNAVNRVTGKGKHTTTALELFPLQAGGAIVDTPGEREFGLWDIPTDDLALFFPEIRPYVGRCRFGLDCAHDEEPGCAVRKAVMAGAISPRRYQSYMRLRKEE